GGAKRKTNQSLFTREKDLQEITSKLTEIQSRVKAFEQNVAKQKNHIIFLEEKINDREKSLTSEQQELQFTQEADRKIEMELGLLNDSLALYEQEKQQFKQDDDELKARD